MSKVTHESTDVKLVVNKVSIDISNELYRTYKFPKNEKVKINEPKTLYVTENGNHEIIDQLGTGHTIPKGWLQIRKKVKEGTFHFGNKEENCGNC